MNLTTVSGDALSAQLDAIAQDLSDPFTKKQASLQADRQAVSLLKADLIDQGAMADLTVFTQEAAKAQSGLKKAQADKGRALQTEQSARQAFVKAQAAFWSNPADAGAAQAAMDASERLTTAINARKTADLAFSNSQRLLADAQQKLASAKGHADAGLESQAKELLAQEREKHTEANAAVLGGQTVVQAEDQLATKPGGMPFENVSIDSNMAGNAVDPLAPKNGSSIINEGAQRETGGGDDGKASASTGQIPQGLTYESFQATSKLIRDTVGVIGNDIVVQGSRAGGTATAMSDIDIAIRVPKDQFDLLIKKYFKTPNPGTAAERTMNYSINNGIIQSGEAKLRGLRIQLEKLLGMDVDISIILKEGPFDNGPMITLP